MKTAAEEVAVGFGNSLDGGGGIDPPKAEAQRGRDTASTQGKKQGEEVRIE